MTLNRINLQEVIQAKTFRPPVTSQELFSILEDATERTFLCAGTADSVQKYVFDGEASKIGFDAKNLVACTSFLFEQKLVESLYFSGELSCFTCLYFFHIYIRNGAICICMKLLDSVPIFILGSVVRRIHSFDYALPDSVQRTNIHSNWYSFMLR